jgi:hypothetical protein
MRCYFQFLCLLFLGLSSLHGQKQQLLLKDSLLKSAELSVYFENNSFELSDKSKLDLYRFKDSCKTMNIKSIAKITSESISVWRQDLTAFLQYCQRKNNTHFF